MFPVFLLFIFLSITHSARILGVFPFPSISHQVVYQPIWRELSLRGHQVTVFTPNPLNDPKLINLTEVNMNSTYDIIRRNPIHEKMSKDNYLISNILWGFNFLEEMTEENIKSSEDLIKNSSKEFDLILVEPVHSLIYGYACLLQIPVVSISSFGAFLNTYDAVGNPTHPVLSPDFFFNVDGEFNLYLKACSAFYNIWYRMLYYWYILPQNDKLSKKYFGNHCPYLGDLERNVSLILIKTNPILGTIRPNVPAVVELGPLHFKSNSPLPPHLQNYLDRSTQGFIYFSLGSNVLSSNLPNNVTNLIIRALAELPYNVLWKWETDHLPNKPKNVMIQQWLPQQEILNHKNIKVFVTQGGLQSMEEAIAYGVPCVGMPFMVDQPTNVLKMVKMGFARSIDHATMTKEGFKEVILDVAESAKYRNKARELKVLLRDQPMSGVEKAVWWIEYVLRHKGAKHLRSPAVDMPWYEYFLLDVAALCAVLLGTVVYFLILTVNIMKGLMLWGNIKIKVN